MRKMFVLCLTLALLAGNLWGEAFNFVQSDIGDILYAVSLFKGFPVSADDTVSGRADFRSAGEDFESNFTSFLEKNRLCLLKSGSGWLVSKIKVTGEKSGGLFSVDAYDLPPARIIEEIGIKSGVCITYQNLPANPLSFHSGSASVKILADRLASLCPGLEVSENPDGSLLVARAKNSAPLEKEPVGRAEFISDSDGRWICDVQNAPLSYAAESLCLKASKEWCLAPGADGKIARAHFTADSFDDALKVLCLQGGCEMLKSDGKYFILLSKNAKEKLGRTGKFWASYKVKYSVPEELCQAALKRFPHVECQACKDSILFCLSDEEKNDYMNFLSAADLPSKVFSVGLQYIRSKEFFDNLPPFVKKESVKMSGRDDSFYFVGSDEAYKKLLADLPSIDKPKSQVRYDVLIIQYQNSRASEWTPSIGVKRLSLGDMTSAAFQLGSVLDFNLDVVSAFGLKFAASLQAAIKESKARVFADTTLNGVSGSQITFQNTNTYRYRDNNLDPDTGKPVYSGITKEIVSGLKLDVTGIASGDGMITSKITASVSRQGTDVSATTGNPPPSSEKVVSTEVRAKSGEPVVLTGLIQEEESESSSGVPLLSKIPILSRLFKSSEKSADRTELVIYLVPSFDSGDSGKNEKEISPSHEEIERLEKEKMRSLYEEFVLKGGMA